jgi:hypothetical protein
MSRRVHRAVEPPTDDPYIEWLATALIQALDAQGIPLAAAHELLPDIAKRISQEARDRAAQHLAEIDARRRAWAQELGYLDTSALAARLDLDSRSLATAEWLGFITQIEWPRELRKPTEYGPHYWSGLYQADTALSATQRREVAETVLLSRVEAADLLAVTLSQFDRLRVKAALEPNIAGLFRLYDLEALREQAAGLTSPKPSGKVEPMTAWQELNDRQRAYLAACYYIDQANEQNERGAWSRGGPSRPAPEWRWMFYGILPELIPSALYAQIEDLGMRDEGTGSTFVALERRKLIQCRYDLEVQITAWGRRVVRAGIGDTPSRPAKNVLKDWAWKHLVGLYLAGEQGLEKDKFGFRTLDYLEDRGLIIRGACIQISAKGREHYEAHWRMYREIYPHVDAPRPDIYQQQHTNDEC